MNEPLFDIRGNLTPYSAINVSVENLEKWFVLPFAQSSTRHSLFAEYRRYTDDLEAIIGSGFYQWLNGGFVRSIDNPNDIDLVTFIDDNVYQKHQTVLDKRFSKWGVSAYYSGVDAYLVRSYPPTHKNFLTFQADEAYWYDWFSRTRRDRYRKSHTKGFVCVTIGKA